jgi:hypothetical protein
MRRDTRHLFAMARLLAQRGDADARRAMYEKFDRNNAEEGFAGADEIVSLDKADGLLHVADRIGEKVLSDPKYRDRESAVFAAEEILGREETIRTLRTAAATNERIRAFFDSIAWAQPGFCDVPPSSDGGLRRSPYDRLRTEIEARAGKVSPGLLSTWGHHALEEDIARAASDLLTEERPKHLLAHLRIFFHRRFPLIPDRLLALADSDDHQVAHAAFRAMRNIQGEAVRAFALQRVKQGKTLDNAILLLVKNYQPGDAAVIEAAMRDDFTPEEAHGVGLHLCDVFGANKTRECARLMEWTYEHTPCSMCRGDAFRILLSNGLAPDWMIRECAYDCSEETRKLAREYLDSRQE